MTVAKELNVWRFRFMWWRYVSFGWRPQLHVNPYDPPSLWLVVTWGKFWAEYAHPYKAEV